eukprot:scaffold5648_cov101-Isochrysis_galbana.AAC.2
MAEAEEEPAGAAADERPQRPRRMHRGWGDEAWPLAACCRGRVPQCEELQSDTPTARKEVGEGPVLVRHPDCIRQVGVPARAACRHPDGRFRRSKRERHSRAGFSRPQVHSYFEPPRTGSRSLSPRADSLD